MTGINHPTPPAAAASGAASDRLSSAAAFLSGDGAPPPPANEEAAGVDAVAREDYDIAGVEALLLHKSAPSLGEDVALATVPIGIAKPPRFPQLVFKP